MLGGFSSGIVYCTTNESTTFGLVHFAQKQCAFGSHYCSSLLQDILLFALSDFTATDLAVQMGNSVRLVSWAGIRFMINEVGGSRGT